MISIKLLICTPDEFSDTKKRRVGTAANGALLGCKESEPERERYFQYTFYLLLRLMSVYTVLVEKEQSEGRVDCIVETPQYVYIFEFKLDGTAAEALQQIEEKGYARPYKADTRQVVKAGVSFSSKSGTIEEWEVRKVSFQNWRID